MKKVLNYVVLALVTILVLFFSLKDNYKEIIDTLFKMDIKWLVVGLLCVVAYWFLKTIPLYYFTKSHQKDFKYSSAVILLLRTQFVNAITPFATGGQPYQVYYLNKEGVYQTEFGVKGRGLTELEKDTIKSANLPGIDFIETKKIFYLFIYLVL